MGTEVVNTNKQIVQPTQSDINSAWGAENVSNSDILIPRIQLAQALSDSVAKGLATPGDIIDSNSLLVIAKKTESAEIIPITSYKTWIRYKLKDNKWDFFEQIPVTLENSTMPYEQEINNEKVKNVECINFLVLLSNKIEELPYILSFRGSSYKVGKKLITNILTCKMAGKPGASNVFSLSSLVQTKDKHTFHVFNVCKKRESTKEELEAAFTWYGAFNNASIKASEVENDEVVS